MIIIMIMITIMIMIMIMIMIIINDHDHVMWWCYWALYLTHAFMEGNQKKRNLI